MNFENTHDLKSELVERFFRYVGIESQSDVRSTKLPSTPGQRKLALLLAQELRDLGLEEVVVDEQAIVTAIRRGNNPDAPSIGFIAHLDTVDVGLSPDIHPQIKHFDGDDICLNTDEDIWLRVNEHSEIRRWKGDDIIFSDGTSVLGADNKAAIAVIMTLLARLDPDQALGDIVVAFVPDEEIGLRGAKALDLNRFPCDFAYTIDCCEQGEVVIENFNAATAEIVFTGITAHPMSAKGVLVNPLLMALDFVSHFDPTDTPEHTDGRQGFFWFNQMTSTDSEARLTVLIREFDRQRFEQRKTEISEVADLIAAEYPKGRVQCKISDTYANIGDHLANDPRAANLLFEAFELVGIKPNIIPMRGGTDGAALSARGIPTPNFFTGAHNFHSRFEFLPISAFVKSYEVAEAICKLTGVARALDAAQQPLNSLHEEA
jgi:tripeptide aminopeptidase